MVRVVEKREEHFLSRFPWMSLALHFPRTQSTPNSFLWDSKPEPSVRGAWLLQGGRMTWHSSSVRSPLEWGRGLNSPGSSSLLKPTEVKALCLEQGPAPRKVNTFFLLPHVHWEVWEANSWASLNSTTTKMHFSIIWKSSAPCGFDRTRMWIPGGRSHWTVYEHQGTECPLWARDTDTSKVVPGGSWEQLSPEVWGHTAGAPQSSTCAEVFPVFIQRSPQICTKISAQNSSRTLFVTEWNRNHWTANHREWVNYGIGMGQHARKPFLITF